MAHPSPTSRFAGGHRLLWAPAAILAVLLFVDGPGYPSPRSLTAAWNLGHVAAFCLWTCLLLGWRGLRDASPASRWTIALAFCAAGGAATEGIQFLVGRDASLEDVFRDIVGGTIAVSWISPSPAGPSERLRRAARAGAATLLFIACLPLAAALSDEGIARLQFPVLADFETPFEASRWDGDARFSVDRSVARHGTGSLRVDMDTSRYSGVELIHFPGDWNGYRVLAIDVLNPSREELVITCRIHDRRHEEGEQRYEDRFNRVFRLGPGWTTLRIALEEVARAPAGRMMDLGRVRAVGIFAAGLPAPRSVFLDYLRLE